MHERGGNGVHDGGAGEDDGHDDGGHAFGAEGEENAEGADGAEHTGEEGDPSALGGEGEVGAVEFQDDERGEDGDDEVGDADEEEGFVATVDGVAHRHLAAMEKDAVEAPGRDSEENVVEPLHRSEVVEGGGSGDD